MDDYTIRIEVSEGNAHTVCPNCGEVDTFQEVGTIMETFPVAAVDASERTITTGEGKIHWDAYQHQGFECSQCFTELVVPHDWQHEDDS